MVAHAPLEKGVEAEADLIERIRSAEVVINIRSSCRFTQNVFEQCGQLRLLSLWGTGTDNVDLAAAKRHGVTVTNTPGVAAISIAEHCLALLLSVARRIPRTDAEIRQGHWPRGEGSPDWSGRAMCRAPSVRRS
jgi:phosphoglycerate dehydrogenase-like enzyme